MERVYHTPLTFDEVRKALPQVFFFGHETDHNMINEQ